MGGIDALTVLAAEPIAVGDKVRAYDFPDDTREDSRGCYVEGVVTNIGRFNFDGGACDRYRIAVSKRMWVGKQVPITERYVYPPVNGTPVAGKTRKVTFGVTKQS